MKRRLRHSIAGRMLAGNLEGLLLAVLSRNPKHGYAMRMAISDLSGNSVNISFGTLYPLLRLMEKRGLIRHRRVKAGKIKQIIRYQITPAGKNALDVYRRRWTAFSKAVNSIIRS